MTTNTKGAPTGVPVSYNAPEYASIDAGVESKLDLPAGLVSGLRTRGERSNADQVSEAGARTVYQIIPATRNAVLNKYGVDAYADPASAAMAAGLLVKESLTRNHGDVAAAVGEYHGGTDRRNWGPRTAAYVGRVTGKAPGQFNNGEPLPEGNPFAGFDPDSYYQQGLGLGPLDARRPVEAPKPPVHTAGQMRAQAIADAGIGPVAVTGDNNPIGIQALRAVEAQEDAVKQQRDSYGFLDRLRSAARASNLTYQIADALDRDHPEADANWTRHYLDNMTELDKPATNEVELDALRSSTSRADYDERLTRIEEQRKQQFIRSTGSTATNLFGGLIGGVADPAAWVATLGVGLPFRAAGVSARAAYLSGKFAQSAGIMAGEGALANVAITKGFDLAGEHMTTRDYLASAAQGAGLGVILSPLHLRGVRDEAALTSAREAATKADASLSELRGRAVTSLGVTEGAGVDEAAVNTEMLRLDRQDYQTRATTELADLPDDSRLGPAAPAWEAMANEAPPAATLDGPTIRRGNGTTGGSATRILPDDWMTADPAVRDAVIERYGLDAHPDEATRAIMAEHAARAERFLEANAVNQGSLKTILQKLDLESTSNTLLASGNKPAMAFAATMLENGQGAAGRRATAAISQVLRERVYMREIAKWDDAHALFRKSEGIGRMRDFYTGEGRQRFNDRVFDEIEARRAGTSTETNQAVHMAADMLERGYGLMAREQRHVGTVGHARIAETSRGYQPHRIAAKEAVRLLDPAQAERRRAITGILSRQFQGEAIGFDKDFADTLAAKYLYEASHRARGGWDVPVNVHDPEAADIVFDTARALGLAGKDAEQLLGKFSRGGAGHTKARLDLDLSEAIPDGKGGMEPLSRLYNRDGLALYRAYARRVSGEVALAQRGIMGKQGLAVYRELIHASGGTDKVLRAYDQVAAELLNSPFGDAGHTFMDNARILSSVMHLGGMGITQFGEYGNALATIGVHRTMTAIAGMRRLAAEAGHLAEGGDSTHAILADMDRWTGGLGVNEYHFTRLYDVPDNSIQLYGHENIGTFTRVLRAGGNVQAVLSGHRYILAAQVRGMAEQLTRMAVEYARTGRESAALRDIGVGPALEACIRANVDRVASFDGKGRLMGLELTKGDLTPGELQEFTQAIVRGSSQIIQHAFTGETGKWAHSGFLKLLTQFRTFGIISIEKQWGRNVANRGALVAFGTLIGSMSFALPLHVARVHARAIGMGEADRKAYLDNALSVPALTHATLNYVSQAGLAGDVWDVGGSALSGWTGPDVGDTIGVRGKGTGGIVNVVPALGALDDIYKSANGNTHAISRIFPYGSLPYVQPLFNAAEAQH